MWLPANWDQETNSKRREFDTDYIVIGITIVLIIGLTLSALGVL